MLKTFHCKGGAITSLKFFKFDKRVHWTFKEFFLVGVNS